MHPQLIQTINHNQHLFLKIIEYLDDQSFIAFIQLSPSIYRLSKTNSIVYIRYINLKCKVQQQYINQIHNNPAGFISFYAQRVLKNQPYQNPSHFNNTFHHIQHLHDKPTSSNITLNSLSNIITYSLSAHKTNNQQSINQNNQQSINKNNQQKQNKNNQQSINKNNQQKQNKNTNQSHPATKPKQKPTQTDKEHKQMKALISTNHKDILKDEDFQKEVNQILKIFDEEQRQMKEQREYLQFRDQVDGYLRFTQMIFPFNYYSKTQYADTQKDIPNQDLSHDINRLNGYQQKISQKKDQIQNVFKNLKKNFDSWLKLARGSQNDITSNLNT